MTTDELISLRRRMKLTQAEMAERVGLSKRAYSGIEAGETEIRKTHTLAVECVSLARAIELADPMLATSSMRAAALRLRELIVS